MRINERRNLCWLSTILSICLLFLFCFTEPNVRIAVRFRLFHLCLGYDQVHRVALTRCLKQTSTIEIHYIGGRRDNRHCKSPDMSDTCYTCNLHKFAVSAEQQTHRRNSGKVSQRSSKNIRTRTRNWAELNDNHCLPEALFWLIWAGLQGFQTRTAEKHGKNCAGTRYLIDLNCFIRWNLETIKSDASQTSRVHGVSIVQETMSRKRSSMLSSSSSCCQQRIRWRDGVLRHITAMINVIPPGNQRSKEW